MENIKEPEKPKNAKENLERKRLVKLKTAPPVRQTLTSYKRMLNANPLLQYEEAGINIDELLKSKEKIDLGSIDAALKKSSTLQGKSSKEFKKPERKPCMRTQSLKLPKTNDFNEGSKKMTIISKNGIGSSTTNTAKPMPETTSKYLSGNKVETKVVGKRPLIEVRAKVNSFHKNSIPSKPKLVTSTITSFQKPDNIIQKPKPQPKIIVSNLRRSLSSGDIKSKSDKPVSSNNLNLSQSEDNLNIVDAMPNIGFSPIMEENGGCRNLVFKTPSAYDRRSVCHFTPRSNRKSSLFRASTPAPVEMQRLQERLNKWLKSRGKPLASFHHLRCFDIPPIKEDSSPIPIDEENKENIEELKVKSESYEHLNSGKTPEPNKLDVPVKNDIREEHLAKVAKEAMVELQRLIEEDYPSAQCLGWLELIRGKYKKAVDEPEYWECRAAIEQSAGNVGNAVEFYKTAIIQGAEVSTVDKSLDQLLKKFSLLNISPSKTEQKKTDGNKERMVREARLVFKSTIIQFAVEKRKWKKINNEGQTSTQSSTKLVVTPVRRSTRMSRSGYVNTPVAKLCTSLREVDLSGENISFQKNPALC